MKILPGCKIVQILPGGKIIQILPDFVYMVHGSCYQCGRIKIIWIKQMKAEDQ